MACTDRRRVRPRGVGSLAEPGVETPGQAEPLAVVVRHREMGGPAHPAFEQPRGNVSPLHLPAELLQGADRLGGVARTNCEAPLVPVLLDGAQAIPHQAVDVRDLDCDFYAFSGHKMCGPTGIGVLYGREAVLRDLPPFQSGGDMILTVSFKGTTYNELPYRFEAGTPHIAGAIGLAAAMDYLTRLGLPAIAAWEAGLLSYATGLLLQLPGLSIVGTAGDKASLVSFNIAGIHPHDLGTILDQRGVAIRAGHHCAMPVMERFGLAGTARASFAFYNTRGEIDQLLDALRLAQRMFA